MDEYVKKFAEQTAGKLNKESPASQKTPMTNGIPNSVLNDVLAGKRRASGEMMGHRQELAHSIAAKMSQAFGMDLTGMQFYQTDAMAGTGMKGISQGNKVVLSSEVDLNSSAGQAVLGHELSHIHAQSQGVGMGHSGLYNNAALERQADREGMMAARGLPVFGDSAFENPGMSYGLGMKGVEGLTPLSGGLSATAGAPMQAWKNDEQQHVGILGPLKKPESAAEKAWKSTKKFTGDIMDMTADFAGNTLEKAKNGIKGAASAVWGKTKGLAGKAWGAIQERSKLRKTLNRQYAASDERRKKNPIEIDPEEGKSKYKPKSLKYGEAGKLKGAEAYAYTDWIRKMSLKRKVKEAKKKLPKDMYQRMIAQADDPMFEDTVDMFLLHDATFGYSDEDLLRAGVYKETDVRSY